MTIPRSSRRTFLGLAAGSALGAFGLSACGTSGPAQPGGAASGSASAGGATGAATMWALSGQPNQGIRQNSVDAFSKLGKGTIKVTFFQNDPYKAKIRTAVGAGQAPTLIFGWGGGILKSYADAGQVEDLTSWLGENADFKDKVLPSTWRAATFDNKIYAVPMQTTQPIVMYYNKTLFDKAGAQPPSTWDDVMNLVDVFNSQGVAPFSLGGQSKWTSMMWLEYLLDRIGGPEVFDAIFANKPDAWSDPAVISTGQKVQELVKANGFIKGFSSITADTNADQALLYTGKAAMMLHGAWVYGAIKAPNPKTGRTRTAHHKNGNNAWEIPTLKDANSRCKYETHRVQARIGTTAGECLMLSRSMKQSRLSGRLSLWISRIMQEQGCCRDTPEAPIELSIWCRAAADCSRDYSRYLGSWDRLG